MPYFKKFGKVLNKAKVRTVTRAVADVRADGTRLMKTKQRFWYSLESSDLHTGGKASKGTKYLVTTSCFIARDRNSHCCLETFLLVACWLVSVCLGHWIFFSEMGIKKQKTNGYSIFFF